MNLIDGDVILRFPRGLFDRDELRLSSRAKVILTVQDPPDGRYPYTGEVNGEPDALKGESSPEMIVDR